MTKKRGWFAIAWLLGLIAFPGGATPQTDPPFELPSSVEMREDIVYSKTAQKELRLDLFVPRGGDGRRPAVVFVHGGGWRAGSKRQFWRQAAHMAERGFIGVTIEYRLSQVAKYPAALVDCSSAVQWLRENAEAYRVDVGRIGIAGGSSGGHLAALIGLNRWSGSDWSEGLAEPTVQAVAAFNPVLNLTEFNPGTMPYERLREFLGVEYESNPELWREASPALQVNHGSAPFLLLHGTGDETIPYQQSVDMTKALRGVGVPAELFSAEGAGHGFFNRPPWFHRTLEQVAEFFEKVLGEP